MRRRRKSRRQSRRRSRHQSRRRSRRQSRRRIKNSPRPIILKTTPTTHCTRTRLPPPPAKFWRSVSPVSIQKPATTFWGYYDLFLLIPNLFFNLALSWFLMLWISSIIQAFRVNCFSTRTWKIDPSQIYDGTSSNAPLLLEASGSVIPSAVQTTGPDMYAVFTSDDSENRPGFRFVYEAIDAVEPTTPEPEPVATTFTSPIYPNDYPNNAMNTWSASTTSDKILSISFNDFETEASYDTLTVCEPDSSHQW